MKNSIVVIYSSHLSEKENEKFNNHILKTIGCSCRIIPYPNFNEFSLTEIYNRAINEHNHKDSIIVFCHNDIIFKTKNWGKILLTKFNNTDFDIIGVAGTPYLANDGIWWHDRTKMYGVVEHTDGITEWVSEFAKPIKGYIKPVVVIDGVFMAVDCNNIMNKFDEDFKGFHMYDISFCIPNYLDGCNIGVTTDIRILHKSIGMTNQQWEINRLQLVDKYKNDLPLELIYDKPVTDEIIDKVIKDTINDKNKY